MDVPTTLYTLTVTGGTGSGSCVAGTVVSIAADAAPTGKMFDKWTGDTANVANINLSSTTITMPASNATVPVQSKYPLFIFSLIGSNVK
jgi:hypothetical protein